MATPDAPPAAPPASSAAAPRTLIVVPTYNEATNVETLRCRVAAAAPRAEMLFIDDASPDGTGERIREMARNDSAVRLVTRPHKLGLGTAYLTGLETGLAEGFDLVVTMDADLSHDPAYLPRLLDAADSHDLVLGSRYVPGGGVEHWGLHRRLLSRGANWTARHVLKLPIYDVTSGFRAYRATALRRLPLRTIRSSGYSFLEEITVLAARHGLRIGEIPIIFSDRQGGRSKISAGEIVFAMYHLLRLRRRTVSSSERAADGVPATADPADR